MQISGKLATAATAAVLGITGIVAAPAASAAPNRTDQQGLVNLALTDVNIQVPVAVAANVCGVAVNVLAQQLGSGPVECDATGEATATRGGGGGGGTTMQDGLVNVAITDVNVQVPIAVAANACGIGVNLLATATLPAGPVDCEALAQAVANG